MSAFARVAAPGRASSRAGFRVGGSVVAKRERGRVGSAGGLSVLARLDRCKLSAEGGAGAAGGCERNFKPPDRSRTFPGRRAGQAALALPWTARNCSTTPTTSLMGRSAPAGQASNRSAPAPRRLGVGWRGSPGALASLHAPPGQAVGAGTPFDRLRALRGYPVVVRMGFRVLRPCRWAEAVAHSGNSVQYGRKEAFLGADINAPRPTPARPAPSTRSPSRATALGPVAGRGPRRGADDDLHQSRRQGGDRPHREIRRRAGAGQRHEHHPLGG